MSSDSGLRPIWSKLCSSLLVWVFGVFILLTFFRIYGTIGGGPGQMIMLGFLLMWFVPLVLLTKAGRRDVGLTLPTGSSWILWAPVVGLVCAFICYGLGVLLYGSSEQHWFQSVAASFFEDERVLQMPLTTLFLMFTIPAMIFSPIGEEILFRGCLQTAAEKKWGVAVGVGLSAFLFATVHLLHHGIVVGEAGVGNLLGVRLSLVAADDRYQYRVQLVAHSISVADPSHHRAFVF